MVIGTDKGEVCPGKADEADEEEDSLLYTTMDDDMLATPGSIMLLLDALGGGSFKVAE